MEQPARRRATSTGKTPVRRFSSCDPPSTSPVVRSMKVCQLTQHECLLVREVTNSPVCTAATRPSPLTTTSRWNCVPSGGRSTSSSLTTAQVSMSMIATPRARALRPSASDGRSVIIRIVRVPGMRVPDARTPSTKTSREIEPSCRRRGFRGAPIARGGRRANVAAAPQRGARRHRRSEARSESEVAASASMRWLSPAEAACRPWTTASPPATSATTSSAAAPDSAHRSRRF